MCVCKLRFPPLGGCLPSSVIVRSHHLDRCIDYISQSDTLKVVRNPGTLAPTQDTSVPSPGHYGARHPLRVSGAAGIQAQLDLYKDFESPVIFPSHLREMAKRLRLCN
jgi:hypothetical protein